MAHEEGAVLADRNRREVIEAAWASFHESIEHLRGAAKELLDPGGISREYTRADLERVEWYSADEGEAFAVVEIAVEDPETNDPFEPFAFYFNVHEYKRFAAAVAVVWAKLEAEERRKEQT